MAWNGNPQVDGQQLYNINFFGNFLFAYRNYENGFDESVIKNVLSDNTKIAVFIKKTKTIYIGTNERFCINPEISFNDDFLNLFADLDYGKYMLITDDNGWKKYLYQFYLQEFYASFFHHALHGK